MARLLTAAAASAALIMLAVQPAAAVPADGSGQLGQTPPALSWIDLSDSRGISIWHFELSLDRGGVTSPDKFVWSMLTDLFWGFYRSLVALALWFLDWVMSFDWLHVVAAPLITVGDAMQSVVHRIGAVPVLLTIAAVVCVAWMMRGRWATGLYELLVALVIAALASGVFAQPVRMLAGDNGLIVQWQTWGLELSSALADPGATTNQTPDQLRKAQTGLLVDTFVRIPTEMINFGQVLDGGKCEGAYNEALKAGPYGTKMDIRDKVNACDSTLGAYADQPSSSMAIGSVVFMPAGFVVLLMALILAGSVIAAGCFALYQALKAIVSLVTGLLPGGSRGSLMLTFAEALISLVIILFTSVFLGIFLEVIQAMFRSGAGDSVPKTFVIVDVLLVVGLIIYVRQRKRFKEAAQRMAELLTKRPGTGVKPTRLPSQQGLGGIGSTVGNVARTAINLAQLRAARRTAANTGNIYNLDARRQAVLFGGGHQPPGAGPIDGGEWTVVPPDPGAGPRGGGGPRKPLPGPAGGLPSLQARKPRLIGALARAGTSAALAAATGGASTAVAGTMTAVKAGKAVNGVRALTRAALNARVIASAALPAVANPAVPPAPSPTAPSAPLALPGVPLVLHGQPSGRPGPARPMPSRTRPSPPPAGTTATVPSATPDRPTRAPQGNPTSPGPARRSRRGAGPGQGPTRQWDKVVRDGQVILIPKDAAPPPVPRPPRRSTRGK